MNIHRICNKEILKNNEKVVIRQKGANVVNAARVEQKNLIVVNPLQPITKKLDCCKSITATDLIYHNDRH